MKFFRVGAGAVAGALLLYWLVPVLATVNDRAIQANWQAYMRETDAAFEALFQIPPPRSYQELTELSTYIQNTILALEWQAENTPGSWRQRRAAAARVESAQRIVRRLMNEYGSMRSD